VIRASTVGSIRPGRRRRRSGGNVVGQLLALIASVENGESLEERDRLRVFAGLAARRFSSFGVKRSA
jgi:hypothetical protein